MAPFRWRSASNDLMLAMEVAARTPKSMADWETIARVLSAEFRTDDKPVELSARACREHMDRLLTKHVEDNKNSLKKSGTEEEYTQLCQLLEDIYTYRRDLQDLKNKENEKKKQKEKNDQQKGLEMRAASLSGMAKRKKNVECSDDDKSSNSDDEARCSDDESRCSDDEARCSSASSSKEGPKKKIRRRASKLTALEMLKEKYKQKAELKDKELDLRKMEHEFQQKKFDADAEERKAKLHLELEERRAMIALLANRP